MQKLFCFFHAQSQQSCIEGFACLLAKEGGQIALIQSKLRTYAGEAQRCVVDVYKRQLVGLLRKEFGIPFINITIGNPYKNPHVNRPYDAGNYVPDEHPFTGLSRMMRCVSTIQRAHPDLPVIGSAFSYLRQYSANLAAGMLAGGHAAMAGFGRMAFANPDFPRQLKETGSIDPARVCVACGNCAQLLRAGIPAGCVVRDRESYSMEALKR